MKKLILAIIVTVAVTQTLTSEEQKPETDKPSREVVASWWSSLDREERLDVLQNYIMATNGEPTTAPVQYAVAVAGRDVLVKPIYPEGQNGYLFEIGHLSYTITLPEQEFKDIIPKRKCPSAVVPVVVSFCAGAAVTAVAFALLQ